MHICILWYACIRLRDVLIEGIGKIAVVFEHIGITLKEHLNKIEQPLTIDQVKVIRSVPFNIIYDLYIHSYMLYTISYLCMVILNNVTMLWS